MVSPGSGTTPRQGVRNRIKNRIRFGSDDRLAGRHRGGGAGGVLTKLVTELTDGSSHGRRRGGLARRRLFGGVRCASLWHRNALTRSPRFANERMHWKARMMPPHQAHAEKQRWRWQVPTRCDLRYCSSVVLRHSKSFLHAELACCRAHNLMQTSSSRQQPI
jgi:hypothetical protein